MVLDDAQRGTKQNQLVHLSGRGAQATMTPVALAFTPGDGGRAVFRAGLGQGVTSAAGQWAHVPDGCDYAHALSTDGYHEGQLAATYGIVCWATSVGPGAAGGNLPDVTTTALVEVSLWRRLTWRQYRSGGLRFSTVAVLGSGFPVPTPSFPFGVGTGPFPGSRPAHALALPRSRFRVVLAIRDKTAPSVMAAQPCGRCCCNKISLLGRYDPESKFQCKEAGVMNWRNRAACLGADPELFFPIGSTGPALVQIEEAKLICGRCEVVEACLTRAMEFGQDAGVWRAVRRGTTRP